MTTILILIFVVCLLAVIWFFFRKKKPYIPVKIEKSQPPNTLVIIGPFTDALDFGEQLYKLPRTGTIKQVYSTQVAPPRNYPSSEKWHRTDYQFSHLEDYQTIRQTIIAMHIYFWEQYGIYVQVTETYTLPQQSSRPRRRRQYRDDNDVHFTGNPEQIIDITWRKVNDERYMLPPTKK